MCTKKITTFLLADCNFPVSVLSGALASLIAWWALRHGLAVDRWNLENALAIITAIAGLVGAVAVLVLTIGIQSSSRVFRRFRQEGGHRVMDSWISLVRLSFVVSGLSLSAAIASGIGSQRWAFVLGSGSLGCLLILACSTVRLLRILVSLQETDDQNRGRSGNVIGGEFKPRPIVRSSSN